MEFNSISKVLQCMPNFITLSHKSDRSVLPFLQHDVGQKRIWSEVVLCPSFSMFSWSLTFWPWSFQGGLMILLLFRRFLSDCLSHCMSISNLHLNLICHVCSSDVPAKLFLWLFNYQVGCLLWQAVCGMSGSGAYLTFPLWFLGARAPFLLLSVVPGAASSLQFTK